MADNMANQSTEAATAAATISSQAGRQHFFDFLGLPRELRQKILDYSFSEAFLEDANFNRHIDILQLAVVCSGWFAKEERRAALPHMASHASVLLATYSFCRNDLVFVIRQRLDCFDAVYKHYDYSEELACEKRWMKLKRLKSIV